jgi:hypothetical protein
MIKQALAKNTRVVQSFWLFKTTSAPITLNVTLPNKRKLTLKIIDP